MKNVNSYKSEENIFKKIQKKKTTEKQDRKITDRYEVAAWTIMISTTKKQRAC